VPPDELTDRELLERGEMEILGRMPWSSNGTFLAEVCNDGRSARAIYKPHKGERPLWDFPDGLYRREVAAYELSECLGWGLIPLTIVREEGPLGVGSLQAFVDADYEQHYFTLLEDETHHPIFLRMAAFDFVANNTDRKSGHCLIDKAGRVWGIDNGLSFHADFKLRTVIWEFAGEPLDDDTLSDLDRLATDDLPDPLAALLGVFERDAVRARARALVRNGELPTDPSGQRYPWPLV
jgi:uncharacterized repeat protein (TIGR03843 family)